MGTDLQSAATPPIVAASPELEHQESNPGLTGYKPVALPLSYVPQMAGGGFEPPISELWALRDNLFSILQAAARSRTGNLLITGQLLYQLSYGGICICLHDILGDMQAPASLYVDGELRRSCQGATLWLNRLLRFFCTGNDEIHG